jgi:hypothetical protein
MPLHDLQNSGLAYTRADDDAEPAHTRDLELAHTRGDGDAIAPKGLLFLSDEGVAEARAVFERDGSLVVEVPRLEPWARGSLGERIDDAVEDALAARNASGPSMEAASDREAALGDQLFRARRQGATSVAIVIGSLASLVDANGALSPADCAAVRFLAVAAADRPLSVVLRAKDACLGGYGDPAPLREVLSPSREPSPHETRERSARERFAREPSAVEPSRTRARPAPEAPAPTVRRVDESLSAPDAFEPARTARQHTAGASVASGEESWRNWTLQLTAARGPQPLAALERVFAESYMPLANALAQGLDDPRARAAQDEFRNAFTRSYTDAFPTFASTTKRPRMVLDAYDAAARTARLHSARSTRLLLVDAMRWDVSRLVASRVGTKLGERAALTDELVLWSALPTTTMRQLETLARGVEAIRAPADLDAETEPTRGRTAEYIRRLRVGPREIHKLDLVQARVHSARGHVLQALPEIAESAADAIVRHAETLPPHTLLFVFGDHGFTVDRAGVAREGGASPEEVLVGAFALLVGDVH